MWSYWKHPSTTSSGHSSVVAGAVLARAEVFPVDGYPGVVAVEAVVEFVGY